MKIFATVIIFLAGIYGSLSAQTLHGTVVTSDGEAVRLANVAILNPTDSTYIAGTITHDNGTFSIAADSKNLIKVWCTGFMPYLGKVANANMRIVLSPDTIMLGEVEVKAAKPLSRIEGDAIVTNIRGTILQNIGTAKDVLGYLPGIISVQGGIEVLGKGAPTFYINGRKMRSYTELDMLKSNKIKKVELVTNPGARYDSSVNAVIRISADRDPGEGFAIDNTARLGYRDFVYGGDDLSLNYRTGKLDVFSNLKYGYNKSKGHSTNVQNSWLQSSYRQEIDLQSEGKSQIYDAQLGADYTISNTSSTGVYYKLLCQPSDKNTVYTGNIYIDNILNESSLIDQDSNTHLTSHTVDGYYTAIFGKWTFDAAFDLLWKYSDDDILSNELINNTDKLSLNTESNVDSRMFAAEAHASHPWLKGNFSFGAEYIDSRRNDDFFNPEHLLNDNQLVLNERNAGIYAQTAQRLGKVTMQLGLRYEHIESRYHEFGKFIPEQSKTYNKVLPSVTLVLPIGKNMLQLSYSRKYKRPLYSQLSSSIYYVNRYLYQSGNPLLKSEYSHNISANYRFGQFMIMANYGLTDGKIISEISQYGDNSNITLLRKENSSHDLHELQAFVTYMPQFGNYFSVLTAGIMAQFYKIDYCGNIRNMNNPVGMVQWKNIVALPRNLKLEASLTWRTCGEAENIDMGHTWSINAGITKVFNRHWQAKISVTDIFNTARKSYNTIYSDCRDIYLEKYVNTRGLECSVRYMFNTTKSKYKGKGAGNNEKPRL